MPESVPLRRVPIRPCAGRADASGGSTRDQRGLTVFELLVAMAISGILSGIAIVSYGNALHKARVARAIAEIRLIERELAKYELDHGNLPDALAEIAWKASDPWGNPYEYLRIQFKANGGGGSGNGNSPGPADDGGRGALGDGGGGNGGGNNGGGSGKEGGCAGGHGHPQGARKDRFLVPINCDYDLYSNGPDGESKSPLTAKQSHDDIIRACDGAFVGAASDF